MSTAFSHILTKYRTEAFSERHKGDKFERLMQTFLRTDSKYTNELVDVWLWNVFPFKDQFGGKDTGKDY